MIHYIMNAVFLCLKLVAVKTIMNVLLLPKSIAVGEGHGAFGEKGWRLIKGLSISSALFD